MHSLKAQPTGPNLLCRIRIRMNRARTPVECATSVHQVSARRPDSFASSLHSAWIFTSNAIAVIRNTDTDLMPNCLDSSTSGARHRSCWRAIEHSGNVPTFNDWGLYDRAIGADDPSGHAYRRATRHSWFAAVRAGLCHPTHCTKHIKSPATGSFTIALTSHARWPKQFKRRLVRRPVEQRALGMPE